MSIGLTSTFHCSYIRLTNCNISSLHISLHFPDKFRHTRNDQSSDNIAPKETSSTHPSGSLSQVLMWFRSVITAYPADRGHHPKTVVRRPCADKMSILPGMDANQAPVKVIKTLTGKYRLASVVCILGPHREQQDTCCSIWRQYFTALRPLSSTQALCVIDTGRNAHEQRFYEAVLLIEEAEGLLGRTDEREQAAVFAIKMLLAVYKWVSCIIMADCQQFGLLSCEPSAQLLLGKVLLPHTALALCKLWCCGSLLTHAPPVRTPVGVHRSC